MAQFFIVLGTILVLVTLLDTFFTVLNYNQRGLMFNWLIGFEWKFLHWLFRPLKLNTRSRIYRAMTGFTLISGVLLWVGGIILGFALVYMGFMERGILKVDPGAPGGFMGALYFSIGQFATVGAPGIEPVTTGANLLSVIETLSSVMLLSMVITYLVNVFSSIEDLRTYCACFPSDGNQVDSPMNTLVPFLPQEGQVSLESHLSDVRSAMDQYFDSIAADHSAVYFNSGKPRFMMPFALFFTAETIEGLKSGLGQDHPLSKMPGLVRLEMSFTNAREQMYELFRWKAPKGAKPMDIDDFTATAEHAAQVPVTKPLAAPGHLNRKPLPIRVAKNLDVREQKRAFRTEQFQTPEEYVKRFVRLRQVVLRLAEMDTPTDWRKEYDAYRAWLEQVPISDDFIRRTSELFDYRPVVEVGPNSSGAPLAMYGWQSVQEASEADPT